MIQDEVLFAWLDGLGFVEIADEKFQWSSTSGQKITIDTGSESIGYPAEINVVSRTTSNLSHLENLVVLECVMRLLEDNYPASAITLEPTWKLGRGSSGGRADILVRDRMESPYLLIECKTAGPEFDREWKKTQNSGGQLFSYAQQDTSVRFLALYTSWPADGVIVSDYHIISHFDDEVVLSKGDNLASYRDATAVEDRFNAWATTYDKYSATSGLFSGRGVPYQVGQTPRTTDDLQDLNEKDRTKKSGDFATILRKYNISGRENAFDVLVNLFVAKMTDELENSDDLQFTWRGSTVETPYDLVERLEILYRRGMKRFLDEDVSYVEAKDIDAAMRFIKSTPDAAKTAIAELFRQQKFYSKSNFGLLDVHNEELFLLNSAVLIEMVDMWQQSKLSVAGNRSSTQALGDMFEIFLDEGVKQTEGQFFTPWPVCDFIIDCIPEHSAGEPPRVLDFACGAGHFLTQYFNKRIAPIEDISERAAATSQLYGIEKEYRLSKISKVSSAMYGALESNIYYSDSLNISTFRKDGLDEKFDILLSNPPFSVDGFMTQLDGESVKALAVADLVSNPDKFDRIEAAFLQRSAEIVAPGGYAALIFPESFYDNDQPDANLTRDILFTNFELKALVKLPTNSFSMTGTSTWISFMKRRGEGPSAGEHIQARVDAIFTQGAVAINDESYADSSIVDQYLSFFGIPESDLLALIDRDIEYFLSGNSSFETYLGEEIERLVRKSSKRFKNDSDAEIRRTLMPEILEDLVVEHKDRLRKYWTVATNGDCLIVSPDTDGKGSKSETARRYLGYKWSKRRGHQGIDVLDSVDAWAGSPLFPADDNPLIGAIASHLAGTDGIDSDIADLREQFEGRAKLDLRPAVDIVSWPSEGSPLAIDLVPIIDISSLSRFPVGYISELLDIRYGKGLPEGDRNSVGTIPVFGSNGPVGTHDAAVFQDSGVIVGRKGSAGLASLAMEPSFPIDTTYFVQPAADFDIMVEFLYLVIDHHDFPTGGSGVPSLSKAKLNRYQIPIVPKDRQEKIVDRVFAHEGSDRNDPWSVHAHKDEKFRKEFLKEKLGW